MTNPVKKDVKAWTDRALFTSRRYLYVLFMCQQSLEKLLKAHIITRTGQFPPRIHNLVRLGELTGLEFSYEDKLLLECLSLYYLQSRYPPDVQALVKTVSRPMAAIYLKQVETLWKRLKRQFARKPSSDEQ